MSLFSSLAKKLGGSVGKRVLSAIPGVGTAMAVAGIGYDVYKAAVPRPTNPYQPPAGPMPGTSMSKPQGGGGMTVYDMAKASKSSMPYEQQLELQRQMDDGRLSFEKAYSYFFGDAPPSAINTAGAVPGWGQLGKRAVGVAGPAIGRQLVRAKKWLPEVVGGALIYKLVDMATGEVLDMKKGPPRRRMNVLNPKALARADRRVTGFARIARGTLKDLGFHVSAHRHVKTTTKKRRR